MALAASRSVTLETVGLGSTMSGLKGHVMLHPARNGALERSFSGLNPYQRAGNERMVMGNRQKFSLASSNAAFCRSFPDPKPLCGENSGVIVIFFIIGPLERGWGGVVEVRSEGCCTRSCGQAGGDRAIC